MKKRGGKGKLSGVGGGGGGGVVVGRGEGVRRGMVGGGWEGICKVV
jgi:hypothetical protein